MKYGWKSGGIGWKEKNMKHLTVLIFCIILFFSTILGAQENIVPVIIDTDLGLDDARALSLFLSSNKADIKAIVVSDGASSPNAGYENILRIYQFLRKPIVPVGIGRTYGAPPWRTKCETLGWAIWPDNIDSNSEIPNSTEIIIKTLTDTSVPIVYVCMGPLTNIAEALKNENFPSDRIEKILYYGTSPNDSEPSWNTMRDLEAARFVFSSELPVWVMHPSSDQLIAFDSDFYKKICSINTDTARLVVLTHKDKRVQDLFGTKHSMVWDEILALYIHKPSLIIGDYSGHGNPVFRFKNWDKNQASQLYFNILSQGMH